MNSSIATASLDESQGQFTYLGTIEFTSEPSEEWAIETTKKIVTTLNRPIILHIIIRNEIHRYYKIVDNETIFKTDPPKNLINQHTYVIASPIGGAGTSTLSALLTGYMSSQQIGHNDMVLIDASASGMLSTMNNATTQTTCTIPQIIPAPLDSIKQSIPVINDYSMVSHHPNTTQSMTIQATNKLQQLYKYIVIDTSSIDHLLAIASRLILVIPPTEQAGRVLDTYLDRQDSPLLDYATIIINQSHKEYSNRQANIYWKYYSTKGYRSAILHYNHHYQSIQTITNDIKAYTKTFQAINII